MGIIREINTFAEQMTIEFDDGKFVEYPFAQLEELELAYAVTVHKSQGSEYPAVIIPLLSGPQMLMNRNLLYTAVTRAKSCVTVVGSEAVFNQMIDNTFEQKRYTTLKRADTRTCRGEPFCRLMKKSKRIFRCLAGILYPRRCPLCGELLSRKEKMGL